MAIKDIQDKSLEKILKILSDAAIPDKIEDKVAKTIEENDLSKYILGRGKDNEGKDNDNPQQEVEKLGRYVENSYNQFKTLYDLATVADVTDAAWSAVELAHLIPTLGASEVINSLFLEAVESAPKIGLAIYAGKKLDKECRKKLILWELGSFVPVLGDLIDIAPIYTWQIGKAIRRKAAEDYIGNREIEPKLVYDPAKQKT